MGKEASTRGTGPGSCLPVGCSRAGTISQPACKWSPAPCCRLSVRKGISPEARLCWVPVCGTILRACLSASPLRPEGTTALPKVCTLPLNIASARALFLAYILSVLFSGSSAGFRQQTPQLGFLGVHVLSRRGRMCRGRRAHVALAGRPACHVLAWPAAAKQAAQQLSAASC